jgi:hypothetical protein
MNRLFTTILSGTLLLTTGSSAPSAAEPGAGLPLRKEYQERQQRVDQWYAPARFGLFYTWGMITGSKGSWKGYENPLRYDTVAAFEEAAKDPTVIAANMVATAKKAGARYIIFTVFHSCGRYFVNYPSKVSGYKWKATKDYFGALVERCHAEGVHLIVYMAACKEHGWIKGGPHLTEEMRDQKNVFAAVTQMINEIIDRHGEKIGGFWFDGNYNDELGKLVHARLPQGIVIHNNESGWGLTKTVDFGTTEFTSGPMDPVYNRPSGLLKPHPQFAMMNPIRDFNEDIPQAGGWWYEGRDDKFYQQLPYVKDPTYLVKQMVSSLGQRRQWNFALGIGPMIDGKLPPCFDPMMENMGRFMAWAAESIHDTMGGEASALNPGWFNDGAYGSITVSRKDPKTIYIHVTTAPSKDYLKVQNNGYRVASVVDLRTGKPVQFSDSGVLGLWGVKWDEVAAFGDQVFKVTLAGTP